jgi:broad specificity phosphatase PhoE
MAGAARYDQLHPMGETQARLLGRYLRENSLHFEAVFSGPLTRQVDTLAHMRNAAGDVGAAWPPAVILAELSEAPIEALGRHCMTERLATDTKLQALLGDLASGTRAPEDDPGKSLTRDPAFFEAILSHVVGLWVSGEVTVPGIETAPEFGRRVRAGFDRIVRSAGDARHVAVVTSNGVIGWLASHVAGEAEPERTCLRHRLFNASVCQFTVADGRFTQSAWNVTDHLADDQLKTIF